MHIPKCITAELPARALLEGVGDGRADGINPYPLRPGWKRQGASWALRGVLLRAECCSACSFKLRGEASRVRCVSRVKIHAPAPGRRGSIAWIQIAAVDMYERFVSFDLRAHYIIMVYLLYSINIHYLRRVRCQATNAALDDLKGVNRPSNPIALPTSPRRTDLSPRQPAVLPHTH